MGQPRLVWAEPRLYGRSDTAAVLAWEVRLDDPHTGRRTVRLDATTGEVLTQCLRRW